MAVFEQYRDEYTRLLKTAVLRPERAASARKGAALVYRNRARYEAVGTQVDIPWWFIGCIHLRESACSFEGHLHNGDPLSGRTYQEPAGRPPVGVPPFKWEVSAIDALMYKGLDIIKEWPIERALYEWERYNGFGYREPGRGYSPYVWADTNHYEKGKFVADHVFDPEYVDTQNGCAAVLNCLLEIDPYILVTAPPAEVPPVVPPPVEVPPFIPTPPTPPSAGSATMLQTVIQLALTALLGALGGAGTMWGLTPSPTPAPTLPPIVVTAPPVPGGECVLTMQEFNEKLALKRNAPLAAAKKQVQENPGLFGLFK